MEPSQTTRLSLLGRLKDHPDDQDSWAEFVACYEPMIQRWCLGFGLQHADAYDVTQDVLLKIARHMRRFEYRTGGKFRAWLRTVAHHAWCDFVKSRRWRGTGDDAIGHLLNSVEAQEDLLQRIEREYDRQLLGEAIVQVRQRVAPHIWQAFEAMALRGDSAKSVASRLGISEGSAYVSKSRVQKMLTEDLARLEQAMER